MSKIHRKIAHILHYLAHGKGRLKFKAEDDFDRNVYEGEWIHGQMSGQGQMAFVSGDIYDGNFLEGVPHGPGQFTYASGDVSEALIQLKILDFNRLILMGNL